jgi:hypothetical protein
MLAVSYKQAKRKINYGQFSILCQSGSDRTAFQCSGVSDPKIEKIVFNWFSWNAFGL